MNIFDKKESINNMPYDFSDESLLRALISIWRNKKIIYLDREDFIGMRAKKRIDRSNWLIDKELLNIKYYIYAHMPTVFDVKKICLILKHFDIKESEVIL